MLLKTVSQSMKENQHEAMNIQDGTLLTATVGARQLGQLKNRWSEYRAITDPRNGPVDPVEALHRTGAILHAVGDVITSEKAAEAECRTHG
jgi:hypothetical protein